MLLQPYKTSKIAFNTYDYIWFQKRRFKSESLRHLTNVSNAHLQQMPRDTDDKSLHGIWPGDLITHHF